jgi:hypothetical protein
MAVKNKKISILASDSPRQTLLPEIHIYINNPKYFCHPIHDVIVTFVFSLLDF